MSNRLSSLTGRSHTKILYFLIIIILLAAALRTTPAQPIQADSLSAASTIGWNALPNKGLDLRVRAFAVVGDDLYLGGRFTQTNDKSITDLGRITRYDTVSRTWNTLSNQGLNEEVTALVALDGDLFVGGIFTQTVDGAVTNLGNVANYEITTETWHALPNQGLNNAIFALAMAGNDLYIGGVFAQTGDGSISNLGRIARYDTASGTLYALPHQGLNGSIYALATDGSDIYVGGGFYQTGDGEISNLRHIARYNSTDGTWHALSNQGLNGDVIGLIVSGDDLYVGGRFTQTSDGTLTNLGGIARYDTVSGTWHALSNQGLDDEVSTFAVAGNNLYVGGEFDKTGDGAVTNLGNIARYDHAAGTWHALPNQGLNFEVYTLTMIGSDLYVGGHFNQVGDGNVPGLSKIARFGKFDSKLYLPLVLR
jgi:N-acetylneuraminic acid mutarotase